MKKPTEEVTGVPTVTVRASYLRIHPLAQELLGASSEDRITLSRDTDSGEYRIGILPMTSEEEGVHLSNTHGLLQSNAIRYEDMDNGNYTLRGPVFENDIDWWALVKL